MGCADARLRGRRRTRGQAACYARVRHGRPRARRRELAPTRLRHRLGVQAVHRLRGRCCWRARASSRSTTRSASAFPEVPDYGKTMTIRHMLHHTSGLRDWGERGGHRRLAARHAGSTPTRTCSTSSAARSAELHARHAWSYSQHRLQPGGDHRRAGQRQAVCRVHARAHLRAARHDAHLLARRLQPRRGAARWPTARAERVPRRHAVRERGRQRRPADHGGRPAQVEREFRQSGRRRRALRRRSPGARRIRRRQTAQLWPGPVVGQPSRAFRKVAHGGATAGYRSVLGALSETSTCRWRSCATPPTPTRPPTPRRCQLYLAAPAAGAEVVAPLRPASIAGGPPPRAPAQPARHWRNWSAPTAAPKPTPLIY